MAEERVAPMLTSEHNSTSPIRVLVVGAGGTGGRLIPGLLQVLRRNDEVAIIDGDHVEDRNLLRQNFRMRDVGENKAEVMARRYTRDGIHVDAYATMLTADIGQRIARSVRGTSLGGVIILGCVDNWKARQEMHKLMETGAPRIWIDAGNERRGGQVILSAKGWPFKVNDLQNAKQYPTAGWSIPGMKVGMPQLLEAATWHCDHCDVDNEPHAELCKKCKQPEASCADRIDIQTVAVNQMSATAILNLLYQVVFKVPFNNAGAFFSTQNTMQPIPFGKVTPTSYVVNPVDTYANKEA